MRFYATAAAAALTLIAGSCADAPTRPESEVVARDEGPSASRAPLGRDRGLTRHISQPLANGATFVGKFTITQLYILDEETRQLLADVQVSGRVMSADGRILMTENGPAVIGRPVTVRAVPVVLDDERPVAPAIRPAQRSCDILFLDLGPIHLDLLGLVLDVAPIVIDLDAETGPGNLLGNLLCALLGLLDGAAIIGLIQDLLDAINALLGGLGGGGPAA